MGLSGAKCLLLLDDQEDVLNTVCELLIRSHYIVISTTDADEALTLFSENPSRFDAVILNYILNGTTGLAVARKIRELQPRMPIILFTGSIWADIKERAEMEGITEYLSKPATVEELQSTLLRVCMKVQSFSGDQRSN